METNFVYAVITRNEYYHGFIIMLETGALREGRLLGTDLHMQLVRMEHYLIVQDYFAPIVWDTEEAARNWAISKGYIPTTTNCIYHQNGSVLYVATV
jgi:hypothetical protein